MAPRKGKSTTATVPNRDQSESAASLPWELLDSVTKKVGPIKNEVLGTVLLLAVVFGGLIVGLTFAFKGTINPIPSICALCFVFAITLIVISIYFYLTHLGYQSTRQEELKIETEKMRKDSFSKSLPELSYN